MSAALPENRDCYMVRLELYVGGRRVSVNDYLRSPGRDFTALNRLAQVRLRARRVARQDDGRATTVRFEVSNPSATTALAVKFNVRDGRTGEAILPAYISEGYIHLLPGENGRSKPNTFHAAEPFFRPRVIIWNGIHCWNSEYRKCERSRETDVSRLLFVPACRSEPKVGDACGAAGVP